MEEAQKIKLHKLIGSILIGINILWGLAFLLFLTDSIPYKQLIPGISIDYEFWGSSFSILTIIPIPLLLVLDIVYLSLSKNFKTQTYRKVIKFFSIILIILTILILFLIGIFGLKDNSGF